MDGVEYVLGLGEEGVFSFSQGVIQLRAVTTTGGASRSSNATCVMCAAIVCRKLPRSHASQVSKSLWVVRTDSITGS